VTVNVGLSRRHPERTEVAIYFIVAEALTNVAKHAHASNVLVDVPAIDGGVRVSVSDDGSAEPTRRAGQGFSACETASTRSAGRYRSPTPPRGTLLVELPMTPERVGISR
jgi:glucose-6-phosphate-specific signal transduction histidine kinase